MAARVQSTRWLWAICAALWAGFAFVFAPQWIRNAYEGLSVPLLNAVIVPRPNRPVEFYLARWQGVAIAGCVVQLLAPFLFINRRTIADWYERRFVGPASASDLGFFRTVTFFCLLVNLVWEDLPSVASLPASMRLPMGLMLIPNLLEPFGRIYASPPALAVLKWMGVLAAAGAMLGWRTRMLVPAATVLSLLAGGILRQYSHFFHTCLVPLQIGMVLSFLPCGDGFSLDARRQSLALNPPKSPAVYGWSRYLCLMVLASAYVCAGLSKLANGGWSWWHGAHLRAFALKDTLNPMEFEWISPAYVAAVPEWVYSSLGIATLIVEVGYVAVLFSPFARQVLPWLAIAMHVGILVLQGILFFDLIVMQLLVIGTGRTSAVAVAQTGTEVASPRTGLLFAASGIAAIAALTWIGGLEIYPFSAWQMYSRPGTGLEYKRFMAEHGSGRIDDARPDLWIGALADSRYRDITTRSPATQEEIFDSLLDASRSANLTDPVVALHVEIWRWAPGMPVDGPEVGRLVNRRTYHALDR